MCLSAVIYLQDSNESPSLHHQHWHPSVSYLEHSPTWGGWGCTRSLLKTLKSLARCSFYLLLTPRHNSLKQKPFYYARDFVGQEFRQGTVGVAYLYFITFEASVVALMVRDGWDRYTTTMFEASILAVARFFPYHLLLPQHTHTHTHTHTLSLSLSLSLTLTLTVCVQRLGCLGQLFIPCLMLRGTAELASHFPLFGPSTRLSGAFW